MVDTLPDSQAQIEAETLGDTLSDAQTVVDTLVALQAVVEAETLGDTQSDMQAMVDTVADS